MPLPGTPRRWRHSQKTCVVCRVSLSSFCVVPFVARRLLPIFTAFRDAAPPPPLPHNQHTTHACTKSGIHVTPTAAHAEYVLRSYTCLQIWSAVRICMYVCILTHTCVRKHTRTCTHKCTLIHTYAHTHTRARTRTHT